MFKQPAEGVASTNTWAFFTWVKEAFIFDSKCQKAFCI